MMKMIVVGIFFLIKYYFLWLAIHFIETANIKIYFEKHLKHSYIVKCMQ